LNMVDLRMSPEEGVQESLPREILWGARAVPEPTLYTALSGSVMGWVWEVHRANPAKTSSSDPLGRPPGTNPNHTMSKFPRLQTQILIILLQAAL
jgi:hypothetical protein